MSWGPSTPHQPANRRDEAMHFLLASYRDRMPAALAGGWPFVIWVEPERVHAAIAGGAPWVLLDNEDIAVARIAWDGREDEHGWSPSEARSIPVIVPRV